MMSALLATLYAVVTVCVFGLLLLATSIALIVALVQLVAVVWMAWRTRHHTD